MAGGAGAPAQDRLAEAAIIGSDTKQTIQLVHF
jgi:hypothetical protein